LKRREFLIAAGAATLAPMAALAAPIAYVNGLLQERLDAGETVFLDFKASWCTTCRAQGRILEDLKAANPAFEENITFIDVDWDEFGRSEIVERFNVPRRSTLIVLKGDQELGRIVAGTAHRDIEALLNTALDAATA